MGFSPKQLEFLKNSDSHNNIAWGSVRSGKSWINNYRFLHYSTHGPEGDMILTGKTERTIRRNIIDPIRAIIGSDIKYNAGLGECHIGKRKCVVRGANDERSLEKIQGDTYAGGIADEVTLFPKSFWDMLLTRFSVRDSQLFCSTNPGSPFHFLKTEYIDNPDSDLYEQKFILDDNPYLPVDYVARLKKQYSGLFFQRYILGLWVLADGIIYDMFDSDINVYDNNISDYKYQIISADYGITNPTVFLKIQWNTVDKVYVTDEYCYDPKTHNNKQKTDGELADDLVEFMGATPCELYIDPSATSFITELRKRKFKVKLAKNDVLGGISFTAGMLKQGGLMIHKRCERLIKEVATYIWDVKAQEKGEDKPVKKNDHALDALRYGIFSKFSRRQAFGI